MDSAVYPGYTIPPYYDSMIAKIIVHGENRFDALMKMQRALYELEIDGVVTNSGFQLDLISDPNVIAGDYDRLSHGEVPSGLSRNNRYM